MVPVAVATAFPTAGVRAGDDEGEGQQYQGDFREQFHAILH
jgi:hypothetical protein